MLLGSLLNFADSSLTFAADAAQAQSTALEEVTVSATRRSENLQSVPISVAAFSGEDLEQFGMENTGDLTFQTPGLHITYQGGALTPFIRGIGAQDGQPGAEGAIALYVDGVYIASPIESVFSFNNVDRVEVLKGPQGTLFGRNASGGLVQVITKTPSHDASLSSSLSYGNFRTTEAKFYGTAGVSESLAGNVAVYFRDQPEGYGYNITTGRTVNKTNEVSVRSKWLFTPTDQTSVTASFGYLRAKGDQGSAYQLLPGALSIDGITRYTGKFYDVAGETMPLSTLISRSATITLEQQFNAFDFKSISAYQHGTSHAVTDVDAGPTPGLRIDYNMSLFKSFSQELQLLSRPDSAIKWIVGAFYLDADSGFVDPLGAGLIGYLVGGAVGLSNSIATESFAGFGEATFPLTSNTNLTAGARWTRDRREITGKTNLFDPDTYENFLTIPTVPQTASFEKPTWRLILDHHFNDDAMVYGSYSRGFKAGNFNAYNPADPAFREEIVDAFEIGSKATFLDGRLRLNPAVFYYKYKNQQVGQSTGTSIITVNAASSEIKGAELEAEAAIAEGLVVRMGAAVLDAKVDRYPLGVCYFPNPAGPGDITTQCDLGGKYLTRAPKFTASIAPTYTVATANGSIQSTLALYHNGGFYWDFANALKERAHTLVNATVGWTDTNERWGVQLFGKNLLDEEYSVYTLATANGDIFSAGFPRTYGVEFSLKLK